MAAILKTFAGLNFYTRTCFIDYYHISFKKSHQTLRPRSCRVNQKFGPWISDYMDTIVFKFYVISFFLKKKWLLTETSLLGMFSGFSPFLCELHHKSMFPRSKITNFLFSEDIKTIVDRVRLSRTQNLFVSDPKYSYSCISPTYL